MWMETEPGPAIINICVITMRQLYFCTKLKTVLGGDVGLMGWEILAVWNPPHTPILFITYSYNEIVWPSQTQECSHEQVTSNKIDMFILCLWRGGGGGGGGGCNPLG